MAEIREYYLSNDLKLRVPTDEELGANPNILGVVTGCHFKPSGVSRNGRYYPHDARYGYLWEEQLKREDVQTVLTNKTMYGTLGHDLELDERALREGMVSHFTTNMKILPGDKPGTYKGYAESYILNTDAGRLLKTYLGAGSNLYVSSRADGDFLPGVTYHVQESGRDVPILDSKKFRLERFDFIRNPGFLEANPKLQEDLRISDGVLQKVYESYSNLPDDLKTELNNVNEVPIKENSMDKVSQVLGTNNKDSELINSATGEVVIKVTDDNAISVTKTNATPSTAKGTEHPHDKISTLPKDDGTADKGSCPQNTLNLTEGILADLLKRNEELQADNQRLREAVMSDDDPKLLDAAKKKLDDNIKNIDPQGIMGDGKISDKNTADLLKSLKTFEENYGTLEDVNKLMAEIATFHETWGHPKDIVKFMEDAKDFEEEYGTQEEIATFVGQTLECNKNLGEPDEIIAALETYENFFNEVGSMEEIIDVSERLDKFRAQYGPLKKVAESLDACSALFDEVGSPDEIRQSKRLLEDMNNKMSAFQELGLENIEEMKTVLQELREIKAKNEALSIAEHTGLNSDLVLGHLKKGMSERQIVDLYNKDDEYGFHRRYLTVREDTSDSDRIPLKMVDPDGDHVQMKNAFCKNRANESLLDMALGQISGRGESVFEGQ